MHFKRHRRLLKTLLRDGLGFAVGDLNLGEKEEKQSKFVRSA